MKEKVVVEIFTDVDYAKLERKVNSLLKKLALCFTIVDIKYNCSLSVTDQKAYCLYSAMVMYK